MPTVSIVIPAFNRADVLDRAIDSALSQTLDEIEVLVVDDASTDGTIELLESYEDERLRYFVHDENRGGSAARNTGIEHATGEYVAFLDSDDQWEETKLDRQVSYLEGRSDEWGGVYCGFRQRRPNALATFLDRHVRRDSGSEGDRKLLRAILMREFAHGGASTLLVRSSVVEELGGFDESFQRHQDWEFLVRLLQRWKLAHVDETLVTKHDTGYPDFDVVLEARRKYLRTFAPIVVELSLEGVSVVARHRFMLAKIAFANGRYRDGLSYLRHSSSPTLRDYLGLVWTVVRGARGG